jgi:hypothetical protein
VKSFKDVGEYDHQETDRPNSCKNKGTDFPLNNVTAAPASTMHTGTSATNALNSEASTVDSIRC